MTTGAAAIRAGFEDEYVLVRFSCTAGLWNLVIEDDGRGFDFSGKLSHQDLDDLRKGPVIIKERVRLLKGEPAPDRASPFQRR